MRLTGERIAVGSPLTTPLIPANKDSLALSLRNDMILARIAKRRTAEMAIDPDRPLPPRN
jgi:hypothetical protein